MVEAVGLSAAVMPLLKDVKKLKRKGKQKEQRRTDDTWEAPWAQWLATCSNQGKVKR